MDNQLQSSFPKVAKRQLCHINEEGGYVEAYVSQAFDGGFVITRSDGVTTRFLEAKWDADDAKSLMWLTKNGRPLKRPWYKR